ARADDVLDKELPAENVGQLLRHQAAEHVGRPAGRERDDEADRPCRIALRPGRCGCGEAGDTGARKLQEMAARKRHECPPWESSRGRYTNGTAGWLWAFLFQPKGAMRRPAARPSPPALGMVEAL